MLSKNERLSREEFTSAFSSGKRVHSTFASVIVKKADTFKAAVVVPKKVHKSAAGRNRLRRQIYEMLRPLRAQGGHYIIILKPAVLSLSRAAVAEGVQVLVGLKRHSR